MSGGYPKPFPLAAPIIVDGVVYTARLGAIDSWNLADGRPLPAFPVDFGSDADRAQLFAGDHTLFFLGDLASDTGKPGRRPLHAMDLSSHRILWTHRVSQLAKSHRASRATIHRIIHEEATIPPSSAVSKGLEISAA